MAAFAPLDVTPMWSRVNDELIEVVDLIPDGKLDWSPHPTQWNFKGNLLHMISGRYGMMAGLVKDGIDNPDLMVEGQTIDGLKQQLRASWQRMAPFLSDPAQFERVFEVDYEGRKVTLTGAWLAFGQLEHDVHHRAGLYTYLDLLGVEHPEPDTILWKLNQG